MFVGHDRALEHVVSGILLGSRSAYLLSGEPGIGKRALLGEVARRLLDEYPHPDFHEWKPESEGGSFGVALMREVTAMSLALPLTSHSFHVVHHAEMFTDVAADVLLKTLEESPDHCRFILTTTDVGLVRPTIRSRCEDVPLTRMSEGDVQKILLARGVDEAQAEHCAKLAHGVPGRALRHVDGSLTAIRQTAMLALRAIGKDPIFSFGSALGILHDDLLLDFLEELLSVLTDVARLQMGGTAKVLWQEQQEALQELATLYGVALWDTMVDFADLYRVSSTFHRVSSTEGKSPNRLRFHIETAMIRGRIRLGKLKKREAA